jgi:hypothetical protein
MGKGLFLLSFSPISVDLERKMVVKMSKDYGVP